MQEARKVVSSPRWQNTVDVNTVQQTDATEEKRTSDTETSTQSATAATTEPPRPATPAEMLEGADTSTRTDTEESRTDSATDSDTSTSPAYVSRSSEAPVTPRGPLLTITTLCALAAAAWSYTTLEDTRSQLATVSTAKASLEQALTDAKAKLAVAEKTVADVKAAIAGATAASAKAASTTSQK